MSWTFTKNKDIVFLLITMYTWTYIYISINKPTTIRQQKISTLSKSKTRIFILIRISIFSQLYSPKQRILEHKILTNSKWPQIYLKSNINIGYLFMCKCYFFFCFKQFPLNFTRIIKIIYSWIKIIIRRQ